MSVCRLYYLASAILMVIAYGIYDGLSNWRIPILEIFICIGLAGLLAINLKIARSYYIRKGYVDNLDNIDEKRSTTLIED